MRTEEAMIWGGIGALTALLALMVLLSFRHGRWLRSEVRRLNETSDTGERE